MRVNKSYPNQMKTRLFSEVERALKAGIREIVLCLPGTNDGKTGHGIRRRKLVAMHVVGDRILFFDPVLNPENSYAAELGAIGAAQGDLPGQRYEGHGMHSIEKKYVGELFYAAKAYALLPDSYKLAV